MKNLSLAFRAFFRLLGGGSFAAQVEELMVGGKELPAGDESPPAPAETRSPALTLLATLQHEARFLDFVMEPLDDYPDDQVGAAARDVQRDLAQVVQRMFAPGALLDEAEGASVRVPAGFDPGRYRLTGNVAGEPPFDGTLRHHGWRATKCELPLWSGDADAALVVTPSEVEI